MNFKRLNTTKYYEFLILDTAKSRKKYSSVDKNPDKFIDIIKYI